MYRGGSTRERALSRVQRRGATVCIAQAGCVVICGEPIVSVALRCRLIRNTWLSIQVARGRFERLSKLLLSAPCGKSVVSFLHSRPV